MGDFLPNPPATVEAVAKLERDLPESYLQFLLRANGGEGFIGEQYVVFWRVEELLDMNKGCEVDKYAPGLFLFGSNGAGEAFAFDLKNAGCFVMVPFIGMSMNDAVVTASTFDDLMEGRARPL